MVRRPFTLFGFLAFGVSTANAGVIVALSPQSFGPYDPANPQSMTFNVDVLARLDSDSPSNVDVQRLQFDLRNTDPALGTASERTHTGSDFGIPPNGDIFFWDFSSTNLCAGDPSACGRNQLIDGAIEDDHLVSITYTGLTTESENMILSQQRWAHIGVMRISLPPDPRYYLLDVLNADESDPARGARMMYGFGTSTDPGVELSAYSGTITGGQIWFGIPEPGTLALIALGVFSTVVFRRSV
jgi:hypothetical protein